MTVGRRSDRGGGFAMLFADGDVEMLDAVVVRGEEVESFVVNDGGFAGRASKFFDGGQRGPERFDDEANDDAVRLREDAGFEETFLGAQQGQDALVEMAKIVGVAKLGGASGPETNDHVRRLLSKMRWRGWRGHRRRRSRFGLPNAGPGR